MTNTRNYQKYIEEIKTSGLSIYDRINTSDDKLWIPDEILEKLINDGLSGFSVEGLAIKTRSKVVKEKICQILGYPTPKSFKKTKPRFPGQNFDVLNQKGNNIQIWNEEIDLERRYIIINILAENIINAVKIINGSELLKLDKTGKKTSKFQARIDDGFEDQSLLSNTDTDNFINVISEKPKTIKIDKNPVSIPDSDNLLPISEIYSRLLPFIGYRFMNIGEDQERNRAEIIHRLVLKKLGYDKYADTGRFPDILHQLLEVKLQTSPTIDLGQNLPSSQSKLDIPSLNGTAIRICDVRYLIFIGKVNSNMITLENFYLVTGEDFFSYFKQFQGKVANTKIQLPIPKDFFN